MSAGQFWSARTPYHDKAGITKNVEKEDYCDFHSDGLVYRRVRSAVLRVLAIAALQKEAGEGEGAAGAECGGWRGVRRRTA